jgi:hypothetical protein
MYYFNAKEKNLEIEPTTPASKSTDQRKALAT